MVAAGPAPDRPFSAAARARITGCSDLDRLDAWVRRAVTVEDLFA